MHLIEPCCAPKHLLELRGRLGEKGTLLWHGHGDLSLAELLPALLVRYCETEMLIAAPSLTADATEAIVKALSGTRAKMDGTGNLDVIKHLTIVTDLRKRKSPAASAWLSDNPYGERLDLRNRQQNDTAIILPDIALVGNINLSYGGHFTAVATTNAKLIGELKKNYEELV